MKIIFLDFDGVLNSSDFTQKAHPKGIGASQVDPRAVKRLDRLVQATGAKIVISSAWRHVWEIEELQSILAQAGMQNADAVIDRTPVGENNRGQEIQEWLDLDPEREVVNPDHEPVESYVILDDNNDIANDQREFFVQTDPKFGLTDGDVNRAIYILGVTR